MFAVRYELSFYKAVELHDSDIEATSAEWRGHNKPKRLTEGS
jgi:hypothetical protein